MALLEALALKLGPAIAKSILKLWMKDQKLAADITSNIIDFIKSKTTDVVVQQRAKRQFEEIGEKVAESLLVIFDADGAPLDENSRTAVAWR